MFPWRRPLALTGGVARINHQLCTTGAAWKEEFLSGVALYFWMEVEMKKKRVLGLSMVLVVTFSAWFLAVADIPNYVTTSQAAETKLSPNAPQPVALPLTVTKL